VNMATMNDSSGDEPSFDTSSTAFFDCFLSEEEDESPPMWTDGTPEASTPFTSHGISWNQQVQTVSMNGSFGFIPLALHDGFHNCRQYDNDPFEDDRSIDSIDLFGDDLSTSGGDEQKNLKNKGVEEVEGGLVADTMNSARDFLSNYFVTPKKDEEKGKEVEDDDVILEVDEEAGKVEAEEDPNRAALQEKARHNAAHQQAMEELRAKVEEAQ